METKRLATYSKTSAIQSPHGVVVFAQPGVCRKQDASDRHSRLSCEPDPMRPRLRIGVGVVFDRQDIVSECCALRGE